MKSFLLALLLFSMPPQLADRVGDWLQKNMGRPYVWGATGYKSYDCSGVIWRMLADQGVFLKRTTARKLFVSLKKLPPGERPAFGTLVFFDDLKHVGMVLDAQHFFHAQTSKGTNISELSPYWKGLISGYRQLPLTTE